MRAIAAKVVDREVTIFYVIMQAHYRINVRI
jgi:hypothetical protein